jgi:predicted nucleic acid-binding protein
MASSRFIVDNSVWQRLSHQESVRDRFTRLIESTSPSTIMVCPPVVAEVGFSARNGADHDRVREALAQFADCPAHPTTATTLSIQNALFNNGFFRAVGALDTVIAAYAMANDAAVLHYDSDFERIAWVVPTFRHEWIIARGSLTS